MNNSLSLTHTRPFIKISKHSQFKHERIVVCACRYEIKDGELVYRHRPEGVPVLPPQKQDGSGVSDDQDEDEDSENDSDTDITDIEASDSDSDSDENEDEQ